MEAAQHLAHLKMGHYASIFERSSMSRRTCLMPNDPGSSQWLLGMRRPFDDRQDSGLRFRVAGSDGEPLECQVINEYGERHLRWIGVASTVSRCTGRQWRGRRSRPSRRVSGRARPRRPGAWRCSPGHGRAGDIAAGMDSQRTDQHRGNHWHHDGPGGLHWRLRVVGGVRIALQYAKISESPCGAVITCVPRCPPDTAPHLR